MLTRASLKSINREKIYGETNNNESMFHKKLKDIHFFQQYSWEWRGKKKRDIRQQKPGFFFLPMYTEKKIFINELYKTLKKNFL